ncbi:hypothetical protein AB0B28_04530 [Glycomyces sp. NPDC046736]|uniref:hypothetical protein n=1 Tax=Glycomyces sp. NPDC046736 TaxID=3155615 RepID=UPI0033F5FB41
MSTDTTATPPETPERPAAVPRQDRQSAGTAGASEPPPEPASRRGGRGWTVLIVAAAIAFCVALVLGATRLFVEVTDSPDSPADTVDAFLEALLDQRDASAAAAWLCAEKADRDLSEAVAAIADDAEDLEWGAITETGRSVGAATVTADISVSGSDAAPATWEFALVAEPGQPQWLICGIAAG